MRPDAMKSVSAAAAVLSALNNQFYDTNYSLSNLSAAEKLVALEVAKKAIESTQ